MQQNNKIIFFGSSKFVIPIIENLNKNFDLQLVVTTEKNPKDSVPNYCRANKIPYLSIQQFDNSAIQQLKLTKTPIAALAYFGLYVPKSILNLFPYGIINIHPSLLPKYRGPTPVQTVILDGKITTGVTIMLLDNEIDHGKIFTQKLIIIKESDNTYTLHEKLFLMGAYMLPDVIKKILKNQISPQEQDHSKATLTKILSRDDGFIDINRPPSKEKLDRMIRAYHPWPGVWTRLKLTSDNTKVVKFLPGKKIQVEGKKPMTYKDFLNGYPNTPENLESIIQN